MANLSKNLILDDKIIREKKGMVILPLLEYEKIKKKIGKLEREKRIFEEEAEILKIIAEGEKEYKEGKLKPIKSLKELD